MLTLPVAFGGERGFLGAAFSRDGTKLFVDYTDANGDIRIAVVHDEGQRRESRARGASCSRSRTTSSTTTTAATS